MTKNSNLKKSIRARQDQTGETYTEARRHLTGDRGDVWLRPRAKDFSPLAGARRHAAQGVPVIILDLTGEASTVITAAQQYSPVVIDVADPNTSLDPFKLLEVPARRAEAAVTALNIAAITGADEPDDLADNLALAADAGGESLLSGLIRGDKLTPYFHQVRELGIASSLFAALLRDASTPSFDIPGPVIVRGDAWKSLPLNQRTQDAAISSRVAAAALSVVQAAAAEALGSERHEALVHTHGHWFWFDSRSGNSRFAPDDFDLPLSASRPADSSLLGVASLDTIEWTPKPGAHVAVGGRGPFGKSSTLDTLTAIALEADADVHLFRPAGQQNAGKPDRLRPTSISDSLEDFEEVLIAVATERLVDANVHSDAVIVVDELDALMVKRAVPPRPAPGLPVALDQALYRAVSAAERHNIRVEAVRTLLDLFVRQSATLRTTVVLANSALGDWMDIGGDEAWAEATVILHGEDRARYEVPLRLRATSWSTLPGRASVHSPTFNGVAQIVI
ncbi:hypothetical protein [Curtobacterium sp. MCSS17_016]|uniref:hypothetical protein n=1 Tax=Curtobacterium sp. MCSS17_016 TaxID=2175644 RepID=UPI000DAA72FA|nr:hypothetical protein [Curtobacterium sp. MCSS17_016]WIE81002.1 hypothetical protein DEJ19_021030 [Curtobacterium sp. MCSS17_016]